jgi:DNA ligase D
VIPDGNYGAGNMIVWDKGTWITLADDIDAALASGELKFRLKGEKLRGGWTMVRLKTDASDWLLIKERDIEVRPLAEYDVLKELPNSVITGKSVEDVPADVKTKAKVTRAAVAAPPKAAKLAGARPAAFPKKWSPELAGTADTAPKGKGWLHEIKYDGYRTLVFFNEGDVKLITRKGLDWTKRYGHLAAAFEKLPCTNAILDGEIVVQDPRGVTSLNLLEQALSEGTTHNLVYFAFDLVYLDGHDLSGVKLIDRKHALEGLIAPLIHERSALQMSSHVEGDGDELFAQASRMGLEGIVSKKMESRYVQKRSNDWVKIKKVDIDTFVVIGYLSSSPQCVTSLVLAEEREEGLAYASRAGSGISETRGYELYKQMSKAVIAKPVVPVPKTPGAVWVEPNWTAEIGYRTRSSINAPRAPVVMSVSPRKAPPKKKKAVKPKLVSDRDLAAVHLTNPEREIFEGSGVTKLDIALHYARVGDWLLPELLRRPVTIVRCPTGELKDCFYQRHSFAGLPDGIETVHLKDEEGRAAFITVTEPKGYLALPQFGAVEFHLWGCRVDDPEHPDRIVMDLDPDTTLPFARVIDGAEILRARMESMGFQPFLRTTGGKGLHLVVALKTKHDWPTVKGFAEALARAAASDNPSLFTAMPNKERRKNKIYIDYLRNGRGASAIGSYSLRARTTFPVATPIRWDELRGLSGGDAFNRVNISRRLETLSADPWDGLESSAVEITLSMRKNVGMK